MFQYVQKELQIVIDIGRLLNHAGFHGIGTILRGI